MTRCLLLLAVLLVAGCDSATDDGLLPIEGALVATLPPIYDDFPIEEQVPPSMVVVSTTGEYNCANYQLVAEIEYDERELEIDVRGAFLRDDVCFTAFGPASASVGLPAGVGDGYLVTVSGPRQAPAEYVLVERDGAFTLEGIYRGQ